MCGQQRVTAQRKEVIVYPDSRKAEHAFEYRGDGFLQIIARRRIAARGLGLFRCGQGLAVDFPVGQQRNRRQHQEVLRHEVLGQDLRDMRAQRRLLERRAGLRHHIGDEADVARAIFARHGHGARNRWQRE